jgi:hypothetical protein
MLVAQPHKPCTHTWPALLVTHDIFGSVPDKANMQPVPAGVATLQGAQGPTALQTCAPVCVCSQWPLAQSVFVVQGEPSATRHAPLTQDSLCGHGGPAPHLQTAATQELANIGLQSFTD